MVLCKSQGVKSDFIVEADKRGINLTVCNTYKKAVDAVSKIHPDVLVFDIIINGGDGIELFNICKDKIARSICLTSFLNDFTIALCCQYGVDYILSDLAPAEMIFNRIGQIFAGLFDYIQPVEVNNSSDVTNDNSAKIVAMLSNIGIKHARLGFKYSYEVLYRMTQGYANVPLCKIYRDVAEKYGTKPNCVERSIRSAVEEAWTNSSLATIVDMFGYSVKADKGKPTNKEFICGIYQKITM